MTAPQRWLSGRGEAPAAARQLLEAARPAQSMPADVHARLLVRASELAATPAAAGVSALLASKPAVFGLTAVAVAGTLAAVRPALPHDTVIDTRTPSVAATTDDKGEPASPPVIAGTAELPTVRIDDLPIERRTPQPRLQNAVSASLAAELEIVDHARRALESDPELALRLADEHARRFPNGQLVASRDAVKMRALQILGRTEPARATARTLLERDPQSLHAAEARRTLELDH
jgi:hypothetical protein